MKLDNKRTVLTGLAFLSICAFWQMYNSIVPLLLTNTFQLNETYSGMIMAADNILALFLLPLFGSLSDKTSTRIGKRMPYVLFGTGAAIILMNILPIIDNSYSAAPSGFKTVSFVIVLGLLLVAMGTYRSPAVALMPDITPKPLRAKANGIINIMGYLGGAFATVLGIFLKLSDYINAADEARKVWIIELPFIIASVLMVISALVLFFTIKENKIAEEMKDEMAEGERLAAVETPIDDDKPMSKANKRMLPAILGAEFLWFMSDNAIGTYIGNYVIYYLNSASSATMVLTIAGGLASVIGFAIAGGIAEKIGRKWTISCGLLITFVALVFMSFVTPTGVAVGAHGEYAFPVALYAVWAIKGFGMALVHNCSFPMVVELCSSKKIGKFTGYYYTASMSAQTVTPILLGFLFDMTGAWRALPIYACIMTTLSAIVFISLVKNIKAKKVANVVGIEALDSGD